MREDFSGKLTSEKRHYMEYCRRMGVRPKFSGNWKSPQDPRGNFIHDKGFWKLLIDRRMYDCEGNFQDLTPVDSGGFEPHMVDPEWTGSQFNVTTVADDAGVERIRDAVIEKESRRTEGGMPTVDYGMDMRQAVSEYDGARFMRDRRTGSEEERRAKANELLDELRSRGYDDFHITESKTHGHSVYVQDPRGNKFRISDHGVSSARRVLDEIHFGLDDDVKQLADIASMRIDAQNRAADARAEGWKESKELERMASDYWDKVKGQFAGETFGRMDRTYMDMDTFMEKHPDARDVMRKDSNGAYVYEWHEPAKTSYVQKPSLEYKEWLLQEGTSPERDGEDVHFMRDKKAGADARFSAGDSEETRKIEQISRRNGVWMKSPSGKHTKLSAKQWLQTRTSVFKNWFGDWENGYIKQTMFESEPVARLTGSEFAPVEGKKLTEQVGDYFKTFGEEAVSPLFGKVILNKDCADDSFAHGMGREKAIAYAAVKDVIEHGMLAELRENHKGRGYSTAHIIAPITINGERYICSVILRKNKNSNYFYLHEVSPQKNLQNEAFITNLAQKPASPGDIAKVIRKIVSTKSSSKIIDKNGEPLVMSHNTEEEFNVFDRGRIGTGQGQAYLGYGFNFSRGGDGRYGDNEMRVYLNARNPLESDGHKLTRSMIEKALRMIDAKQSTTLVGEFAGDAIPYGSREYERNIGKVIDMLREYDDLSIYASISMTSYDATPNDVIEAFKSLGFDSTVERDSEGRIMNAVVFDPNQIKSADPVTYDDAGNVIPLEKRFDEGKDDIRFVRSALGAPYQGSKSAIAEYIVEKLPKGKRFVDLFSGGGAVTHAAMRSGKYGGYRMNDLRPAGQELFLRGMNGDFRDYDLAGLTEERFKELKAQEREVAGRDDLDVREKVVPELLLRSFNDLGRNYAKGDNGDKRARGNLRRVQALEELKEYRDRLEASATDYRDVELKEGDVVYADIPYENTDQRGYGGGKFDKAAFVEWAQAQDVPVYVSEYTMPEGWTEIGSWNRRNARGGDKTEKLWVQSKFAERAAAEPQHAENYNPMDEEVAVRFSKVEDPAEIERLERGPKRTYYRSMVLIDGKLYPPMASKEESGKRAPLREPSEIGSWERSDEHPEKAFQGDNGKWYFKLNKDNGNSVDKVAYNPYFHASNTMINDQFKEAQSRGNLVVVECEIPESELAGGYQAEKAHKPVGEHEWNSGVVQSRLTNERKVVLSRWLKPLRIVPDAEVAAHIMEHIAGDVDEMPSNVVTPGVRAELEKLGMRFVETDNKGKLTEGEHAGESWTKVYDQGHGKVRFMRSVDDSELRDEGEPEEDDDVLGDLPGGGELASEEELEELEAHETRPRLDEELVNELLKLAKDNKDNVDLRVRAMRGIGGNLAKLRRAMARQFVLIFAVLFCPL